MQFFSGRAEVDSAGINTITAQALGLALLLFSAALVAGLFVAPEVTAVALAAVGIGVPSLWLFWAYPTAGALTVLMLTSSFFPVEIIDIRLPVGGLDLRDLSLLAVLGLLVLRQWRDGKLTFPWWHVSGPLTIFLALAVFSAAYALLYRGVAPNWAMSELRILVFYSVFFIVAWSIKTRRELTILLVGAFILADLTTLVILVQQSLGQDNPLLAAMTRGSGWRVWDAGAGGSGFGAVRVIPPGHVLMYVLSTLAFVLMVASPVSPARRAFYAGQLLFLGLGLLLTFTRAQWLASAIAFLLVFANLTASEKKRLLGYTAVGVLITLVVYGSFGPQLERALGQAPITETISERVMTMFQPEETLQSGSLQWRVYETDKGIEAIAREPVLGVGLGNSYRETTPLYWGNMENNVRFTRFVHNSYIYVATKMGITGLAVLMWFSLAFLFFGWRWYKNAKDERFKRIALGLLTSFVGLMTWAFTHPHFMQVESTAVIGMMAGIMASMQTISERESATESAAEVAQL